MCHKYVCHVHKSCNNLKGSLVANLVKTGLVQFYHFSPQSQTYHTVHALTHDADFLCLQLNALMLEKAWHIQTFLRTHGYVTVKSIF